MSEQLKLKKALDSAYAICLMVKETCEDIIAGSTIPEDLDIENAKKATMFVDFYEELFKNK